MLRALAPNVETALTAPERVSLAGDQWALVLSGRQSAGDFLTLASGFAREDASGVLDQITKGLAFARDHFTTPATRPGYEAFVRGLLGPQFATLGLSASSGDTDERRALRAVVVDALGSIGRDPAVIAQARALATEALAGRTALDGSTADTIVGIAAQHGDQALWNALVAAAGRAKSPEEQSRYLYALGDFEDPALVQRGLEYALTPALRAQDAGRYLGRFLSNPAVNARAWTFVKEHWTELEPKMTVAFADVRIVQALGSFCDAVARDDVTSFFASHTLGNASRTVDQTVEQINNCIAVRDKQTGAVTDWLRAR